MEHPLKEKRESQKKFLESLPEAEREAHRRFFRIGNASYSYHALAQEPTKEDYKEWLEGLDEPMKGDMLKKGFEKCKTILSFTRYVMEKRDIGMDKWLEGHLSKEDYIFYKNRGSDNLEDFSITSK